ncbi:hypothetical protein CYLTODRAFT_351306 [Cylindrobasidium torrendii FP15055 ss-10]|uniref:F-box domain-containing protein n=1 Tax=Cylindrobasidium torrendii FP15055 ss-10 TaxID=1314674 RepID=A0A0D7BFT3_9AGAR|nr:hypothetical protein CYLTODRAFT_351306 [Cylindrobasidium torrendii FP15055 ss-10]
MSRLPQELVDHIIDHLYDDLPTLRTCAAVCSQWLPPSRVHLFSKVQLDLGPQDGSCERLLIILDAAPQLVPCVKELRIVADCSQSQDSEDAIPDSTAIFLPILLKTFTHVRRLELTASEAFTPASWDTLPHPIRQSFESLFHAPSLVYVRLGLWAFRSWNLLLSMFAHSPSIRGLALREIEFSDYDIGPYDGDQPMTPPLLEFLTLDYVECSGVQDEWARRPWGIDGVREFRLAHSAERCGLTLLHALGDSLEHLHLKPGTSKPEPMSLKGCPNLRSLRLTVEDYPDIWFCVLDILSTIAPDAPLERIAIEFFIDPKHLQCWPDLDAALTRFQSLRDVAIGVFAPRTAPEFQKVSDEMESIDGKGVLRVYQLALRSHVQRVCSGLTPSISRFEECL